MQGTHRSLIAAATLAGTLLVTPVASAFVIGPGSRPGLGVDAAGTAYVAWNGPEATNSALHFCRLPRGAKACAVGPAPTLPAPASTTSASRPFVLVSGSRISVVQYRYPTSGMAPAALYRFTSTDGGMTFGAPEVVGSVPFEDAVPGPGDTLSGVPVNGGMYFQNVVLDGSALTNLDGTSAVPKALLSSTHQNQAAVGLLDAATPVAVFTSTDAAQFSRYSGSGAINDSSSWTAAVDIGLASYPRLAGGPSGLLLVAGDANGRLFARKWNGSGFGPPVSLGPGRSPDMHLFQDAAGRFHAVFQRDSANPLQLIHAVSDDGVVWRSAVVATQDIGTAGGIADLRVATAADHIGVTVWHGGTAVGDIRVVAVGPDAAGRAAPKPKPTFTATGSAGPSGVRIRIQITAKLVLPKGVSKRSGCKGTVKFTIKRVRTVIAMGNVAVGRQCSFTFTTKVAKATVGDAKTLAIQLEFGGNAALAPTIKVGSLRVTA